MEEAHHVRNCVKAFAYSASILALHRLRPDVSLYFDEVGRRRPGRHRRRRARHRRWGRQPRYTSPPSWRSTRRSRGATCWAIRKRRRRGWLVPTGSGRPPAERAGARFAHLDRRQHHPAARRAVPMSKTLRAASRRARPRSAPWAVPRAARCSYRPPFSFRSSRTSSVVSAALRRRCSPRPGELRLLLLRQRAGGRRDQ